VIETIDFLDRWIERELWAAAEANQNTNSDSAEKRKQIRGFAIYICHRITDESEPNYKKQNGRHDMNGSHFNLTDRRSQIAKNKDNAQCTMLKCKQTKLVHKRKTDEIRYSETERVRG